MTRRDGFLACGVLAEGRQFCNDLFFSVFRLLPSRSSSNATMMKIALLIKQVPDTRTVRMDEKTGTVVRDGNEAIVNPLDLYALKAALDLKAAQPGTTVTAISMGPPNAEKALKEALALGADDALLICDRAAAGSDTKATATILTAALNASGPFDLVLTGERATDGDTGQVGPEIAAAAGFGLITFANSVTATAGGIEVERKTENEVERWKVELPALVSVTKAVGEVGLPTLKGKMVARRRVVPVKNTTELGLAPGNIGLEGSPTRVVRIFRPSITRNGIKLQIFDEASLESAVDVLASFVKGEEKA